MRPLRLDIEGFGTFRDPVTLDFSDTDFFALVGATGSGKTTIIDAICFALYGSAPRWPRANQVSLAMAPSTSHTRVALFFEVAGQRFAAVRVLARSARGSVTTKQSRLVSLSSDVALDGDIGDLLDGEVEEHADSPDTMNRAIEALLGLTFAHFTQSVVLPQGGFARFLHAGKSERQDLLVSLLGLGVYEQVAQRSNQIAKEAGLRAETLGRELGEYVDTTEAAEAAALVRVTELADLEKRLPEVLEPWLAAETSRAGAQQEAAAITARAALLAGIQEPPGLASLAEERTAAMKAVEASESAEQAAEAALVAAERAAEEAGEPASWKRLLDEHEQFAGLTERGRQAAEAEKAAALVAEQATQAARDAEAAVTEARAAHEHVRLAARADDLATSLVAGEPCPVCLHPVDTVPDRPAHLGLQQAAARVADAERTHSTAQRALQAAHGEHRDAAGVLKGLRETFTELKRRLEGRPDPAAAEAAYAAAQGAQKAAVSAGQAARGAREATRRAREQLRSLESRWSEAGRALSQARDRLAQLTPPATTGDHIADWATLTEWTRTSAEQAAAEAAAVAQSQLSADQAEASERQRVLETLAAAEVAAPPSVTEVSVSLAVAKAATEASARLDSVRERRASAERLTRQVAAEKASEQLHKELGSLLGARNFERWLVEEALSAMMIEASVNLSQLSGGQFELEVDAKQDILVIDHNDASSRRPVQTLSGGETFQASLALALALSSQIAALSPHTGQLDTILLDEGFGTLDPSTLDVVAATLEQLAGGGERTVGVVTHVAELAERVPIRFEVTREGSRSTVEKRYL